MLMKYEDLVSQPKEMAVKLYHFINASEDIDYALQYLESHYKNDQPTSKYVSGTLIFLRFELFVSETFFSMYVFPTKAIETGIILEGISYVLKNDLDYQQTPLSTHLSTLQSFIPILTLP